MFKTPNQYRDRTHPKMGSDNTAGNNGFFNIPHHKISNYVFRVMASDGMGWEHISVSVAQKDKNASRCPTWFEMCYIKDLFWDAEDCTIQYHPKKSQYVNVHEFCLHIWRPINAEILQPPREMAG